MKLKDALKSIAKTTGAEQLNDSSYAEVKEFLDTGNMALNRVLTGDVNKGIPVGRITTLFGESGSGKSLIAANTAALALKTGKVDVVYIFDSEGDVCPFCDSCPFENDCDYIFEPYNKPKKHPFCNFLQYSQSFGLYKHKVIIKRQDIINNTEKEI